MTIAIHEAPRARNNDAQTSKAAAALLRPSRLQAVVLHWLNVGPMTAVEIAEAAGIRDGSISPRMTPLEEAGLIRRTEHRRQSAIPFTRPGIVWQITPAGSELIRKETA